jgi:aspartyl-tRNA synthetase
MPKRLMWPRKLRSEWVVEVKGLVNKRPEKNIKADVLNGDIELEVLAILC